MDKTTVGNLCKPYIGQLKLDDNTLIDYFDIASVDNIEKQITGYTTYKFAEAPSRARKKVEKGNILVSTVRPNLNAVALFDEETENMPVASTGFCVLECKANTSPRFLFRYLQSQSFVRAMVSQATGASYPAVSDKIVRDTKLPAYSYEEQIQIANVLDATANIISKRKHQLQKLDELVKARFVELFGDYIKDDRRPLSEVAIITGGLTKNSNRNIFETKMPYLRVANVFYNRLDLREILEIGVKEEEIEKTLLQAGDLLFVEGNGSIEQIGRVAIWDGSIDPILHQNHLIKARFNNEIIAPEYALFYFMLQDGRQQIISKSVSTSGLNTLSVNKVSSLLLPIPPIALQKQFGEFFKQTDKSKVAVQKALDEAQLLFDSLMQKYFE